MDHPSHSKTHTDTPFKHKVYKQIRKMLEYYHRILDQLLDGLLASGTSVVLTIL